MRLADIKESIVVYAKDFDASTLSGSDAVRGVQLAATIKNAAATIEALCAARVDETDAHRRSGERSAAHLLAQQSGTTVGEAKERIETAKRLSDQPELGGAARRGEVSPQKAAAISEAAAADPSAEAQLLDKSRRGASLNEIRDEASRIKARSCPDPEARRKKIHAERYLRQFTDAEGGWNLRVRDNPEVGAQIMARLDQLTDDIFNERRRSGAHEAREAYAADALTRLATGTAPGAAPAKAKIIFRLDWPAWLRGWPEAGEVMELVGFGPVAASAIEEAIGAGGFIAGVITKGEALTGVAHLGRAPTAKQQSALEWLYPSCAALGCTAVARLERDHRIDWADTHVTMLDWLDRLCGYHHDLKTRKSWMLVEGRGKRPFVAPDDPRYPGCRPPAPH